MLAEIVCIGTELLMGRIVNGNAAYLAAELAALGIDCHFQTVVGDNRTRLSQALELASHRADIVITTGGLGPTPDDITVESIAETFAGELTYDRDVVAEIEAKFIERGIQMPSSNRKQAYRPRGSQLVPNPGGTAPGFIWQLPSLQGGSTTPQEVTVVALPGVSREMQQMWCETVRPYLASRAGGEQPLLWRELKFYGIGESLLAEKLSDLLESSDPTVAPYASKAECRLRIASKSGWQGIEAMETEIRSRVGEYIYGIDDDTLESVVAQALIRSGKKLAIAESCTGGLLSTRLTEIPGSSAFTEMNLVAYDNASKEFHLEVNPETLEEYGAVSFQAAGEMAAGIQDISGADIAVAITGIAGPSGGTPGKPIGLVYVAVATGDEAVLVEELRLGNIGRDKVRWRASQETLNLLRKVLSDDADQPQN